MRDVNEHFGAERSRRGFLGLVGRIGIVSVGAAAGIAATGNAAHASPACCSLEYQPGTSGYCKIDRYGNYICPGNGGSNHWTGWTCCTGSRTYQCAECRPRSIGGCWDRGAFVCSAYWTVNPRGCSGAGVGITSAPKADAVHLAMWQNHPWGSVDAATG